MNRENICADFTSLFVGYIIICGCKLTSTPSETPNIAMLAFQDIKPQMIVKAALEERT